MLAKEKKEICCGLAVFEGFSGKDKKKVLVSMLLVFLILASSNADNFVVQKSSSFFISEKSFAEETTNTVTNEFDRDDGGISHDYDLWVNDTWVPVNQTFLEIPELNYSVTFFQVKEKLMNSIFRNTSPGFIIYVRNLTQHQNHESDNYYYSGVGDVDMDFYEYKANGFNRTGIGINVTINPFEIKDYYFMFIKRFLNVFTTPSNTVNQTLSYKKIISLMGPHELVTPFVLKNNSKTIPLFGPKEESYYKEMAEEGKQLEQQIKNNQQWKNNETLFGGVLFRNSYLRPFFVFNVSLFIDTVNYNATINISSYLDFDKLVSIYYFIVKSSVVFYDKNNHTEIKIKERFSVEGFPMSVVNDFGDKDNNGFLFFEPDLFVAPVILIVATMIMIRYKKEIHDSPRNKY